MGSPNGAELSRDHEKLDVFRLADELVLDIYRYSKGFPPDERYGLQSQVKRAAVSVPTNIVEGCARRSTKDYLHFLTMSLGSANELRYLLNLCRRLGILSTDKHDELEPKMAHLVRSLQKLTDRIRETHDP